MRNMHGLLCLCHVRTRLQHDAVPFFGPLGMLIVISILHHPLRRVRDFLHGWLPDTSVFLSLAITSNLYETKDPHRVIITA